MKLKVLISLILFTIILGLTVSILNPYPGHPGGIYGYVLTTVHGPIKIEDWDFNGSAIEGNVYAHVSPDKLSAVTQFVSYSRKATEITFDLVDYREGGLTYITLKTQPGVEVALSGVNTTVKHVSPGTYITKLEKTYAANTTEVNTKPTGITNSTPQESVASYNRSDTPLSWGAGAGTNAGESEVGFGTLMIDNDGDAVAEKIWYGITKLGDYYIYIDKDDDKVLEASEIVVLVNKTGEFDVNTLDFIVKMSD